MSVGLVNNLSFKGTYKVTGENKNVAAQRVSDWLESRDKPVIMNVHDKDVALTVSDRYDGSVENIFMSLQQGSDSKPESKPKNDSTQGLNFIFNRLI